MKYYVSEIYFDKITNEVMSKLYISPYYRKCDAMAFIDWCKCLDKKYGEENCHCYNIVEADY